jgi:mannosyl-oligosaccharide glucosidase
MAGYGWDRYDPRHGGVQTIHDTGNDIDISTSFVKISDAGDKGGHWAVRVKGKPRDGTHEDLKTTVVFAIGADGGGLSSLEVVGEAAALRDTRGIVGDVTLGGEHPVLGQYKIVVTEGNGRRPSHTHPSEDERPLDRTFVSSNMVPAEHIWQSKGKSSSFED